MKNMIFTTMMLALTILFTGCDKANAQDTKKQEKDPAKNPSPHAILIIDEVAYVDGCKGCDCVEEDVCVCEAKADCDCCRKNLKKVPHDKQEKCKEIKKNHAKTTAECKDCKKDDKGDTACNTANCKNCKEDGKRDTACNSDTKNGDTACNDSKGEKDEAKKGK